MLQAIHSRCTFHTLWSIESGFTPVMTLMFSLQTEAAAACFMQLVSGVAWLRTAHLWYLSTGLHVTVLQEHYWLMAC